MSNDLACDVIVIGAGPAGTAAAITLARAGVSVRVLDKATFPRDKCCGDGLTTLALRELEDLGLASDDVDDWFDIGGAVLRSPSGRQVRVPLPPNGRYAAVAPRRSFDHALVELARREGVPIHDGHAFKGVDRSMSDRCIVQTADLGDIPCRYVIAADGMWSPVRKAVGATIPGYRGEWHAFRQYASGVTGAAASDLIVWFEPDLLPGYAWSFPLPGGRANLGFGVLRESGRSVSDMAGTWRDLLRRPHIVEALGEGFELEGRHSAWPIPARVDSVPVTAGRVHFIGDAAMATDVMTGEGIGQALLTGRLSAEAIITAGANQPAVAAESYAGAVERHLFADHRMSQRLGAVLKHRRGTEGAIAIVSKSGGWGKRNFARWMFEDEPRAIATSPARWHRRMFSRDGAGL